MTGKTKVFLIVQGTLCLLLAGMICAAAIGVYREGAAQRAVDPLAPIYTPARVAEKMAPVLPLMALSLALTAAGLALGIRDPRTKHPVREPELRFIIASRPCGWPSTAMANQRGRQKMLTLAGWLSFGLCLLPPAVYLLDGGHFPEDTERMIAHLAAALLPWLAVGFGCLTVCMLLRERSVRWEAAAAVVQHAAEKNAGYAPPAVKKKAEPRWGALRAALILTALLFLLMGVTNGGARDVLYKAANICTECIGLG